MKTIKEMGKKELKKEIRKYCEGIESGKTDIFKSEKLQEMTYELESRYTEIQKKNL